MTTTSHPSCSMEDLSPQWFHGQCCDTRGHQQDNGQQLGTTLRSTPISEVLTEGAALRLIIGVLAGMGAARQLTVTLHDKGCMAEQMLFISEDAGVLAQADTLSPSLYSPGNHAGVRLWCVREPACHASQVRDNTVSLRRGIRLIDRLGRSNARVAWQLHRRFLVAGRVVGIVQLDQWASDELPFARAVLAQAVERLQVIDL